MKIVEQTGDRLVLAGVPGGLFWMVLCALFGLGATVACAWLGVLEWRRGNPGNTAWLGLGLAIGQVFFWTGCVTLAVGRERLELDRRAGRGRYTVRSPIVDTGSKPFEFDLASVDSVALEMAVVRSPGGPGHGGRSTASEVFRARLRVRRPRRAVALLERGEGGRERVRALAERVALLLGVDLVDATAEAGPERRGSVASLARPLARSGSGGELDFPAQPEPPEWEVHIDPEDQRIAITRIRRGGPPVLIFFLLIASFLGLIAAAMVVGAWLPGQTFNGQPITVAQRLLLTAPGVIAVVLVPWLWLSLFAGRRRVEIDASVVRSFWDYPGRGAVRLVPGLNRFCALGESVPTGAVESVAMIKGAQGRLVEIRADRRRARVGSAGADEAAERASLEWLARSIRVAVRACASADATA
jgi:hypothetical protein